MNPSDQKGQFFKPHVDATDGAHTSTGFVDSARLATVFVYLADVPNGGETKFTNLEPSSDVPTEGDTVMLNIMEGAGEATVTKANNDGTFDVKWTWNGSIRPSVDAAYITKVSPRTLSIHPKRGMAVVHFPQSTKMELDVRTMHEGAVAIDEKWLLATWM